MKPAELARRLRESGMVSRSHTLPHHGEYTVANHSWQAAMLLLALHPGPSFQLLRAVLVHDVGERYCGDSPAPVKWDNAELAMHLNLLEDKVLKGSYGIDMEELTEEEQRWVKAVDYLEFLLWTDDQLALGNQHVKHARLNIRAALGKLDLPPEAKTFFHNHQWNRNSDRIPT